MVLHPDSFLASQTTYDDSIRLAPMPGISLSSIQASLEASIITRHTQRYAVGLVFLQDEMFTTQKFPNIQ